MFTVQEGILVQVITIQMCIANYNTQLSVGLLCLGLRGGDLTGEVTKKMFPPSRAVPGMYRGCYEFKNDIPGQVPAMPWYGGGGRG